MPELLHHMKKDILDYYKCSSKRSNPKEEVEDSLARLVKATNLPLNEVKSIVDEIIQNHETKKKKRKSRRNIVFLSIILLILSSVFVIQKLNNNRLPFLDTTVLNLSGQSEEVLIVEIFYFSIREQTALTLEEYFTGQGYVVNLKNGEKLDWFARARKSPSYIYFHKHDYELLRSIKEQAENIVGHRFNSHKFKEGKPGRVIRIFLTEGDGQLTRKEPVVPQKADTAKDVDFNKYLFQYAESSEVDHMFVKTHYDSAIMGYQKIVSAPETRDVVAAHAIFFQARSFQELRDKDTAKIMYKKVIKRYPDSGYSALAKEILSNFDNIL